VASDLGDEEVAVAPDDSRSSVVEEGKAIIARAGEAAVSVRLSGGVAVMLSSPEGADPSLVRQPRDIDLITDKRGGAAVATMLTELGYQPDVEFNAINGHRRLLFASGERGTRVDVFVGAFAMCHEIPIGQRLTLRPITVPLAELLLMKLQIFELNEKDQRDILNLLSHHAISDHDVDAINGAYVAELCAEDWGLWRTCMLNLDRSIAVLDANAYGLRDPAIAAARINELVGRMDAAEKPRRWKLRQRVGDRVRWYDEVEEVG
jgi:hypothetical protein